MVCAPLLPAYKSAANKCSTGVVSGRVSKTPTKKKSSPVKQEYNSSDSSAFGEMPVTGNSFDFAAMNFNSGSSFDAGLVDGWDSGIV